MKILDKQLRKLEDSNIVWIFNVLSQGLKESWWANSYWRLKEHPSCESVGTWGVDDWIPVEGSMVCKVEMLKEL